MTKKNGIKSFANSVRGVWLTLKWYERTVASCAVAIVILGAIAWLLGPLSIDRAIQIVEPVFIGLGALSIILLWAQVRISNMQEQEANIWKRVVSRHDYFSQVPRTDRAEAVRKYFKELGINRPPSAYHSLDVNLVETIWADNGTDQRPPGRVIISNYLDDWEDFCGAIRVGVLDEEYAREMEGTRVINAFFGYRSAIDKLRQEHNESAKARTGSKPAQPFVNKYFLELQTIATNWHRIRQAELERAQETLRIADEAADSVRSSILEKEPIGGVPDKARNHGGH